MSTAAGASIRAAREGAKKATRAKESLVRTALQPKTFRYVDQLTNYLKQHFILHEPGRFLMLPKPYGVSCLGVKSAEGGVFKNSVYNQEEGEAKLEVPSTSRGDVLLEECIPALSKIFQEPKLHFCVGLKRYLSGAIVLPAREEEFKNMTNSIKYVSQVSKEQEDYHFRCLALLQGIPPELSGTISGYATFHKVGRRSEYIFVPGSSTRREKSGKFAVEGTISYTVLAKSYGCSLVEFGVNKFARHLPRLTFSNLLCPILGDPLYTKRLLNVDGKPVLAKPGQQSGKQWFPNALSDRLGISPADLLQQMPFYCHVYRTTFPRYGWAIGRPQREQDIVDLLACAPPPTHFLAMVEALEMDRALAKFLREEEPGAETV